MSDLLPGVLLLVLLIAYQLSVVSRLFDISGDEE